MYMLAKPAFTVADVLDLCLGAIDDTDLVNRIQAVRSFMEACEPDYEAHAAASTLHLVPLLPSLGKVTKDELVALYEDHLSATRGSARDVYNKIKGAAPNRLCPLCSIGTVAHIDHHLPKRRYPDLSVLPLNLVPACHFCNDTKRARYPKLASEQTFHPYYDVHLLAEQWVFASVDRGPPPVLVIRADAPATWSFDNRAKVARHLLVCGLVTTYATNANTMLSSIKDRLTRLYAQGGAVEVQRHLDEERNEFANKPNNWEHVAYQTLASDRWFVDGGFLTIAS